MAENVSALYILGVVGGVSGNPAISRLLIEVLTAPLFMFINQFPAVKNPPTVF